MKEVRIIRSARKHVRSRESILEALNNAGEPIKTEPGKAPGETALTFIGPDSTGKEIEVVAIDQPQWLLVIHAMPADWRKR